MYTKPQGFQGGDDTPRQKRIHIEDLLNSKRRISAATSRSKRERRRQSHLKLLGTFQSVKDERIQTKSTRKRKEQFAEIFSIKDPQLQRRKVTCIGAYKRSSILGEGGGEELRLRRELQEINREQRFLSREKNTNPSTIQ
ncbi:hypothetical protein Droror1_Dr00019549 [Drosera rotundifolia]